MNIADVLILIAVACAALLAVRKIVRDRRSGKSCSCGCGGSCAGCRGVTGTEKEKSGKQNLPDQ